jgi:hypothetical protein
MSPTQRQELFASFDVETDGSNPLQHSMRSIGIVVFNRRSEVVGTFYTTLLQQANCTVDPKCKRAFWDLYPQMWQEVNTNPQTIAIGMQRLSNFLKTLGHCNIKWVASPANFDWMWLKCYYEKYGPADKQDIGFFCHDLVSLVRSYTLLQGIKNKTTFLTSLSDGCARTHNALDDAMCQGVIYMNLRKLLTQRS